MTEDQEAAKAMDPHRGMTRRDFMKLSAFAGLGVAAAGDVPELSAQTNPTGPGAIRFAIIGDFGETLPDQTYPVDRVGAMVRSWAPDWVVSVGDNNYILGQASTIDVNIGKNFTSFIYPKTNQIPIQYPYPPDAPLYNRFIPCLGNHDYGDVFNDMLPTTTNVQGCDPYLEYFRAALRTGTPASPNTTIQFADNAIGQTYKESLIEGNIEDYASFQEAENNRFFDVRLGTPSGPSSVHLFVFDSDPGTPYSGYAADRTIPNRDGSPSAFTEIATQAHWLQQRLAASTARWKIVIFHHPPYNSAPGAADAQFTYVRWPFQEWGATAVITGHVHNYERLEMPDLGPDNEPDFSKPTIPYIINGAGGFIPENGFDPSFVVPGSQVRVSEYGAQLVTADENSINFLYYDIHGVLRDVRTIYSDDADGAPQVEFGGREFPVEAVAGMIQIPVQRLGDVSEPLSVDFTTVNGTAQAGINFVETSGTLEFAAGQKTANVSIEIFGVPVFGPGLVPWESLLFSVGLSAPNGGTLGFFNIATVLLVNTIDTPITNQLMFIEQTYIDIFQRAPSAAEVAAAVAAIGAADTWLERARWIYSLIGANYETSPIFRVSQIYALLNLSFAEDIAQQSEPPSFPDLQNGLSLWDQGSDVEDSMITVSQAYNENVIALLDSKFPGFGTDNTIFIGVVYKVLVLSLLDLPTQEDLDYWNSQLSNATTEERNRSRSLMLARLATESFDPPPVAGMTAFNLAASGYENAIFGILIAGLLRIQLTAIEFEIGYAIPSRIGPDIIVDNIYNILQSSSYAARFRVTSFDGFIDSVKGSLPEVDRAPDADPEGEGISNLAEFAFAIQGGRRNDIVQLDIQEEGEQKFALFSYRVASNTQRVELLVQVSEDLTNWSAVGQPIPVGGIDRGTYVLRTIKIPVPPGAGRRFFRVRARLRD